MHGVHLTGLSAHHQWSATAAILYATSDSSKNGIRRAITDTPPPERLIDSNQVSMSRKLRFRHPTTGTLDRLGFPCQDLSVAFRHPTTGTLDRLDRRPYGLERQGSDTPPPERLIDFRAIAYRYVLSSDTPPPERLIDSSVAEYASSVMFRHPTTGTLDRLICWYRPMKCRFRHPTTGTLDRLTLGARVGQRTVPTPHHRNA